MAIRDIVQLGHPALRIISQEVDAEELVTEAFQQFLDDFGETFSGTPGVGIAAPQVGINSRVIIVDVKPDNPRYPGMAEFPLTVVVNPIIEWQSNDLLDGWEGDLSASGRALVLRAKTCIVTGLNRRGQPVRFELTEPFHARVFQHGVDHLDGIFLLDRVVRKDSIAELSTWETYWRDAVPFGMNPAWERASLLHMKLTHEVSAWAAVALVPNEARDALHCAAHYRLPQVWATSENRLDSGSMNARAFCEQREVVDN